MNERAVTGSENYADKEIRHFMALLEDYGKAREAEALYGGYHTPRFKAAEAAIRGWARGMIDGTETLRSIYHSKGIAQ